MKLLADAWRATNTAPDDFKEFAEYARPLIEAKGNTLRPKVIRDIDIHKKAFEYAKQSAIKKLDNMTYTDISYEIDYISVDDNSDERGLRISKNYSFNDRIFSIYIAKSRFYSKDKKNHWYVSWDYTNSNRASTHYIGGDADFCDSWEGWVVKAYKSAKKDVLTEKYIKDFNYTIRHLPWQE